MQVLEIKFDFQGSGSNGVLDYSYWELASLWVNHGKVFQQLTLAWRLSTRGLVGQKCVYVLIDNCELPSLTLTSSDWLLVVLLDRISTKNIRKKLTYCSFESSKSVIIGSKLVFYLFLWPKSKVISVSLNCTLV